MAKYISKLINGEELYYLKDSEARSSIQEIENALSDIETGSGGSVTVTNGTTTLDWNTDVTVGTVNGVDITAKLPVNPNTWRPLGTTSDTACAGDDSRLSDSRPASDVSAWAKASTKPSYTYSEIGYTVNTMSSSGGSISLDGTTPLYLITLTGNVSSLSLSVNPAEGHSCRIIFTSSAERTIAIAHDSTDRICPGVEDLSLQIPANGYAEVDFLTIDSKVYVRGV